MTSTTARVCLMDGQIQESDGGVRSRVHPLVPKETCEKIFLENYDRLVRFLSMRLGSLELARDVAQETILKALQARERYDGSQKPWPWLKTIAINTAIDHIRRTGREVASDELRPTSRDGGYANSEETIVLEEALSGLPPRQRIALSLKYLNDWHAGDAAEFLGLSRSAFDQLLKRAKKRLGVEYRKIEKSLQGIAAATSMSFKARAPLHRINRVGDPARPLGMISAEHLSHTFSALVLIVGGSIATSSLPGGPNESYSAPYEISESDTGEGHAKRDVAFAKLDKESKATSSRIAPGRETTRARAGVAADPARNPRRPEDTNVESMATGGKDGRLIYAVGTTRCLTCPPFLFRSSDAGASWSRLPAAGLLGTHIAIPPNDDLKVFATGPSGLQVSNDGGVTFAPALTASTPVPTGPIAVSPMFHEGDPTVLIGAQTLMKYSDSEHLVSPYPGSLTGPFEPSYSPTFESDSLFLLGGLRQGILDGLISTIYICNTHGCNYRQLPARDQAPRLRLISGEDGLHTIYAFTQDEIFINEGGLIHFRTLETPWHGGTISDLEVSVDGSLMIASIGADTLSRDTGLYISHDGGIKWQQVASSITRRGATDVAISDGRIVVALADGGVACSSNQGRSFDQRCSSS